MVIKLAPLPPPAPADVSKFSKFGREVKDSHPGKPSPRMCREPYTSMHLPGCVLLYNQEISPNKIPTVVFELESES
ncbi:hypothetical protein P691DRAFT_844064 [Macrolepiota fuliginosa MF-IS2]|uniref:Uncharacterized protein n=1 Tax=Macrolepiota fuliginosa MF-IS2 TaxID=1400762 RepID=A0A9P5X1J3_9AGAR|nr:hypothetical protein P691DRAFT_844064 [Macrolepiota fuliginosa MF-IS2]